MKLGVIFGGNSYEHEISIVSAIALLKLLPNLEVCLFLDNEHTFYQIAKSDMKAKYFSSMGYKKSKQVVAAQGAFSQEGLFKSKSVEVDLYINLVHGGDGEDGVLSALLDFYKIPYIGPRKEAAMLSFDKYLTKLYAKALNVNVLPYYYLRQGEPIKLPFPYPVIVKPARLGSSIGVSIVYDSNELGYALDVAYEFDPTVLIEPFIEGVKEYNLAGFKADEFVFSVVEEPQKEKFLDFDKKYRDFARTKQVFEAQIDEPLKVALQKNFTIIYNKLFEGSLIRCDFFVIDNEVYLNEINPIPGSMANYLFDDFKGAIERLAYALPQIKKIPVTYSYIHSINAAKGK